MVDNGTGAAELRAAARRRSTAPSCCGSSATWATRAPSTWRRARARRGRARPAQRRLRVRSAASSSASPPRSTPAPASSMAAGVMRDGGDRGADRHRRHRARPHPAGLRLPERRAARGAGRPGRRSDRSVRRRGGVSTARRLPRGRRLRREAVRLLGGRRPGAAAARAGAAAGSPRTRAGTHEHSATLGSGSARKNYLMGFGRGYLLRKWGVLTPRRLPAILARELSWAQDRRSSTATSAGSADGCAASARRADPALPVR